MAAELNIDEYDVVGRLVGLWAWFDQQSRDGHAPGVTDVFIDRHTRVTGFTRALTKVGWLHITKDGVQMPNFDHFMSNSAKNRLLNTRRQQRKRTRDVTQLSRSERDKSVTKEEKRREDISRITNTKERATRIEPAPLPVPTREKEFFAVSPLVFRSLYERIREVTGEPESRAIEALYRHYAECLGPAVLERALSATRQKHARKPGAYFNRTCMAIAKELGIDLGAKQAANGGVR
jgi:hypothetical protein